MDPFPAVIVGISGGSDLGDTSGIPQIVHFEGADHDNGDQPREKRDDHEGIEDAEPMHLRFLRRRREIPVKPVREGHWRRNPRARVRKLNRSSGKWGKNRGTRSRGLIGDRMRSC